MTTTNEPSDLPYYILVSQSDLSSSTQTPASLSSSFAHPTVQYHYLDDSPLALLPQSPNEQVLLLDYDPTRPTARSISHNVAISGMKVAEAHGASTDAGDKKVNTKMYILDTTAVGEDRLSADASQPDLRAARAILAQFKQRNTLLRRVYDCPDEFPDAPATVSKSILNPNGTLTPSAS